MLSQRYETAAVGQLNILHRSLCTGADSTTPKARSPLRLFLLTHPDTKNSAASEDTNVVVIPILFFTHMKPAK